MHEKVLNQMFERCAVTGKVLGNGQCKAVEYRNKFKSLFNCNTNILVIDPESGQIEDANEHALNFYGYSHEEMTQLTIFDINQLSNFEIKRRMREAETKENNHFIFPHILKNGEIRTVKVYSTPIREIQNKRLFSIVQDVTEEERLARSNAYNEKLYHQLFENNQSGIVLMDLKTHVLNANRKFHQLFGTTKEMHHQKLIDIIDDEDMKVESLMLTQIATSGYSHTINTQRKGGDGQVMDLNIQVLPVYIQGKLQSIFAIFSVLNDSSAYDFKSISEMKELYDKERLASLNHITQGLTHELNTPLGVCLSNMSYLEQEVKKIEAYCESKEHVETAIKKQLGNFKEVLQLTNESLETMRQQLNNLDVLSKEVAGNDHANALETLMEVLFQYQPKAEESGVSIVHTVNKDVYTTVGTPFLECIYRTLLDNALSHGFTEKSHGEIAVNVIQEMQDVVIEVYDNGAGIPEHAIQYVFDPYYSTHAHKKHSGKGLTFLYDVLTRFNMGTIAVESEEGIYTKVTVRLYK